MTDIALTATAAERIKSIVAAEPAGAGLRVAVEGGGCSGFQYEIGVAPSANADDVVIERDGARLFVDPVSLPFLLGSQVDWVDELIGASFKIKNPNATSACGCGVSFAV
ncbi:MAG: iron-sulfur cluster assembly accessory protein [Hyphomonadaceae bacterium]|jgi:iron-sulfur cluster assembly accessory protein|nr:iron-sulfur cluster assembly accessory protein [Hyphomonadaceae bacterium]